MFGFGKKKNDPKKEINELMGKEEAPKKQSTKYILANEREANNKKEELMDKLHNLNHRLNGTENMDDLTDKIQDLMNQIRRGDNLSNSNVQYSVDCFIEKKIDECINFINRNSKLGASIVLNDIKKLVQDRNDNFTDLKKYVSKDYVSSKLQYDLWQANQQILTAEIIAMDKEIEELTAQGNASNYEAEVDAIMDQIELIQEKQQAKQKDVDDLRDNLKDLNLVLASQEAEVLKAEIPGFDMVSKIEGAIGINEANKERKETQEMLREELRKSTHQKVSTDKLTVGATKIGEAQSPKESLEEKKRRLNAMRH